MSLEDIRATRALIQQQGGNFSAPPLTSSVFVEFELGAFGVGFSRFGELIKLLDQEFHLAMSKNLIPFIGSIDHVESQISAEILDRLPQNVLFFHNGIFINKKLERTVVIDQLGITQSSIKVVASGSSDDALAAMEIIFNSLNKLSGIKTAFSKDIFHAIAYQTVTVEKLNFSIKKVLSESTNSFIESTVCSDEVDYKLIGSNPVWFAEQLREGERSVHIAPRIRRLELEITRVDMESGYSEQCVFSIAPKTKTDVNFGEFVVITEYPFAVHQRLVAELRKALK